MRKTSLLLGSCIALTALLGLSGQAFATHDPACDKYGNSLSVQELNIDTPDSHVAGAVSGVTGSGLACGSEITFPFGGTSTLNDRATITTPPGVVVNPASNLTDGAYAGVANVNILSYFPNGIPVFAPSQPASLKVDKSADTDCPSIAVACYKGTATGSIAGHNWSWVTESGGRYTLTIGTFYNDTTFQPAGLTKINTFSLCAYQGSVGGGSCGTSGVFLQKNGEASGDCSNGNGIYSATVTQKGGATSAPASFCVDWELTPPNCGAKCNPIDIGGDGGPGTGGRKQS